MTMSSKVKESQIHGSRPNSTMIAAALSIP